MTTNASPGYGSKLYYSTDDVTWISIAQLKKFSPVGSKQNMVDQTNLRSPGAFTQPLAAQVDTGELEIEGVYKSGDSSQLTLGQLHAQLTLTYFKVVLSDATAWTFQGFVSEFKPWDVEYNKHIPFSAKLRVAGAITNPLSVSI